MVDLQDLAANNASVEVTTEEGHKFQVPVSYFLNPPIELPLPNKVTWDFRKMKVVDGQDPSTKGQGLLDSWRAWGVRFLKGNQEEFIKRHVPNITHTVTPLGMLLNAIQGMGGDKFTAGMISLEDLMAVKYGTFEQSFRLHSLTQGQHLAAWLIPSKPGWPPELDLFEFWNDPELIRFGSVLKDGDPAKSTPNTSALFVPTVWNRVRLEWTPDHVRWFLNDVMTREIVNHTVHEELYYLVTWEGNGKTGKVNASTVWPGSVELAPLVYTPLNGS